MMTTNKLTKTFASGSLAIGVLAGAVLTATSASATTPSPNGSVTLTWAQWTGANDQSPIPLVIPNGNGATATYVGGTFAPSQPGFDTVTLFKAGDEYEFTYSAIPGTLATDSNAGTLIYDITFPTFVNGVSIDSDTTETYGSVTKKGIPPFSRILTSPNGDPDPSPNGFLDIPLTKALRITDTFIPNIPGSSNEGLSVLSNNFREAPHVPEPGTILGLLAVGGLGMVSRFKKQK
jgi:hypothetical protein